MFRTKKLISLFFALLLIAILASCSNENIDLDEDVSSIEVYQFNEDTLVDTIEDEDFINKLVKKLNKSSTESTADIDFESPDYDLVFKSDEDKEVFNISYFKEVQNLGVTGRYWEKDGDLMYKVELELPTD